MVLLAGCACCPASPNSRDPKGRRISSCWQQPASTGCCACQAGLQVSAVVLASSSSSVGGGSSSSHGQLPDKPLPRCLSIAAGLVSWRVGCWAAWLVLACDSSGVVDWACSGGTDRLAAVLRSWQVAAARPVSKAGHGRCCAWLSSCCTWLLQYLLCRCCHQLFLLLLYMGLPGMCGSLQQLCGALYCEGLLGIMRVQLK